MTYKLAILTDAAPKRETISRQLGSIFDLTFLNPNDVSATELQPPLLCDINLRESPRLLELKEWLNRRPKDAKVVFVTDKANYIQSIQVQALGATDIVHHPLNANALLNQLFDAVDVIWSDDPKNPINGCPRVGVALDALHNIFSSACRGMPLDLAAINTAGDSIVGHIEEQGLKSWIDTVRRHHNQTYQHCLLVTGVAVAFGQHLGVSKADRHRLSFAGMVHDIGKARVPVAILEKPTRLTDDEMAIMRMHPEFGLEMLKDASGLGQDMLDIVIHHHEYLDGSGYPHGLSASEISDFVRISTICDVFGALLERRAYKAPMSGDAAYQILLGMGPKLDKDLVRAFRFASTLRVEESA